jgi:hypothetical protein
MVKSGLTKLKNKDNIKVSICFYRPIHGEKPMSSTSPTSQVIHAESIPSREKFGTPIVKVVKLDPSNVDQWVKDHDVLPEWFCLQRHDGSYHIMVEEVIKRGGEELKEDAAVNFGVRYQDGMLIRPREFKKPPVSRPMTYREF